MNRLKNRFCILLITLCQIGCAAGERRLVVRELPEELRAQPRPLQSSGTLASFTPGSIDNNPTPKVVIVGQVQQPGEYYFPPSGDFRILDAIARAHGIPNKVVDTVFVCRRNPNQSQRTVIQVSLHAATRDEADNLILMPDDIITVEPDGKTLMKDSMKYVGFAALGGVMLLKGGKP